MFYHGKTACGVCGHVRMFCCGGVPGCGGMSFHGGVTGYRVLGLDGTSYISGVTSLWGSWMWWSVLPWLGDWLWNSWPQRDVLPWWNVPPYGMSYLVRVPDHGVIPIKAGAAGLSNLRLLHPTLEVFCGIKLFPFHPWGFISSLARREKNDYHCSCSWCF